MDFPFISWLHLAVRWLHVFAAILWIGSTWHFGWLDRRFREEAEDADEQDGDRPQVWMMHHGAFYAVEKRRGHGGVPRSLSWFRYEALFTWLSGMALLTLVYYLGGAMVDLESDLSPGAAAGLSLAFLAVAWLVYDRLWLALGDRSAFLAAVLSYLLAVGTAYGLTQVFTGRAAYIQVGAMLGTLMTANVWFRILPAQKQMLAAVAKQRRWDATARAQAGMRSNHNSYMVVPVLFIMLSSHYPVATYGNLHNWQVLSVLLLAGGGLAHWMKSLLAMIRRPPRSRRRLA